MTIRININPTEFKPRSSLVKAKENAPSKDTIRKARKIVRLEQHGDYMIAFTQESSNKTN